VQLLRSQEAWIFEALTSEGFDPREFELGHSTVTGHGAAPVLIHQPTGFYYVFSLQRDGYVVEYSPAEDKRVGTYGTGSWESIVGETFGRWLGRIRREVEAPDYWGELRRENEIVAGPTSLEENTPFSASEQAEIRQQFEEVKALLRGSYTLSEAQFEALDARLDYLADAAARLGRIDWREALVGALLGLVVQAVVPPEPVRTVLLTVTRGLGHLFGLHVPPELSAD
jgi:hypothetical protein